MNGSVYQKALPVVANPSDATKRRHRPPPPAEACSEDEDQATALHAGAYNQCGYKVVASDHRRRRSHNEEKSPGSKEEHGPHAGTLAVAAAR